MVPDFLLTVAVIWGIAAITPGPNFFFIVRCALTSSRRMAMSAVAGVAPPRKVEAGQQATHPGATRLWLARPPD
jgi:hypothetical protein